MATAQGDFVLVNEVEDVDDFGSIAGYALEGDVMRLLVSNWTNYFLIYFKDLTRRLPQSIMLIDILCLLAQTSLQENVRARLVALKELAEA